MKLLVIEIAVCDRSGLSHAKRSGLSLKIAVVDSEGRGAEIRGLRIGMERRAGLSIDPLNRKTSRAGGASDFIFDARG